MRRLTFKFCLKARVDESMENVELVFLETVEESSEEESTFVLAAAVGCGAPDELTLLAVDENDPPRFRLSLLRLLKHCFVFFSSSSSSSSSSKSST